MKYLLWSLRRLVKGICDRLQNKFDVFIIIEGSRGLGKSTLGFRLMKKVRAEMKRRGVEGYRFFPKRDLLYTRDEVKKYFHKWKHSGMADEMINVTFNRDFYNEDQKDIIKMINMNRDHNNFFIACVPRFKTLDSQIKNLSSMRITVVRRGVAIIQMPNKSIYSPDKWDERINEKIEREWLQSGTLFPKYSRLTTFRGFLRFPKLSDKEEELYQEIKNEKRNIVAQEKQIADAEEEKTPFQIIYENFINKKIKNNEVLEGMAQGLGFEIDKLKRKIRRQLKKDKLNASFSKYYYDEKKSKDVEEIDKVFGDEEDLKEIEDPLEITA